MPKIIQADQLFTAAISVFLARGYEKATTKEIAEVAGVNEATLFRKYGSKAALLNQALQSLAGSTPLDGIRYTGKLEADLIAIIQAYLQTSQTHGDLIPVLLAEAPRYPELREALQAPVAIMRAISAVLARYQEQGLLRPEPPMMTIAALIGPLVVTRLLRRAGTELSVPEVNPQTHVALFLQGRRVDRDPLRPSPEAHLVPHRRPT